MKSQNPKNQRSEKIQKNRKNLKISANLNIISEDSFEDKFDGNYGDLDAPSISVVTPSSAPPSPSRLKLLKGINNAKNKAASKAILIAEGSQLRRLQEEERMLVDRIR